MWRGCCRRGNRSKGDDDDAAETVEVALLDTTALLAEKAAPCIFERLEISVDSSSQIGELKKAQSSLLPLSFIAFVFCFLERRKWRCDKERKKKTQLSSLLSPSVNSLFFFL